MSLCLHATIDDARDFFSFYLLMDSVYMEL